MLTDKEVKRFIKLKKITIDPYDESSVRAGKYDLHLGLNILVPQKTSKVVDPQKPVNLPYKQLNIEKKAFVLAPGKFILGQTKELIGLAGDMGMLLDGSTSL